jgi:hypothetical protein
MIKPLSRGFFIALFQNQHTKRRPERKPMKKHGIDARRTTKGMPMKGLLCACCALACFGLTPAWAWNPFASSPRFLEPELSASEWRQVDLNAGWARDSDTTLFIEISNKLPGPLACHGAVVGLQNGAEVKKSFSPYLYVPVGAVRQAGVNGVKKGQMKGFTLSCHCWKREADARCSDPKKAP